MKAVIGIDAGHGGKSFGTYTFNTVNDGLFEKDFALEQALMIEQKLLKNGFRIIMTRRSDENPGTVTERAQKMVRENADFALSIHFNGFGNKSANGCEVFVPYAEVHAGIESGFYTELKKYFSERPPFARSSNFDDRNEIFDKKLNVKTRKFEALSDKKDYFGFVRACWEKGISADLLEICFLTNEKDFSEYQKNKTKIADGIAKSIVEAFGEEYISTEEGELSVVPKIKRKVRNSASKIDLPY